MTIWIVLDQWGLLIAALLISGFVCWGMYCLLFVLPDRVAKEVSQDLLMIRDRLRAHRLIGDLPRNNQRVNFWIKALHKRAKCWKKISILLALYELYVRHATEGVEEAEERYWATLQTELSPAAWKILEESRIEAERIIRRRTLFPARVFIPWFFFFIYFQLC